MCVVQIWSILKSLLKNETRKTETWNEKYYATASVRFPQRWVKSTKTFTIVKFDFYVSEFAWFARFGVDLKRRRSWVRNKCAFFRSVYVYDNITMEGSELPYFILYMIPKPEKCTKWTPNVHT
jgi:hypothetical protein